MIDNIKKTYALIPKGQKLHFIEEVAKEVKLKPSTMRSHWFGNFWAIPEEHQGLVIYMLQNFIKNINNG